LDEALAEVVSRILDRWRDQGKRCAEALKSSASCLAFTVPDSALPVDAVPYVPLDLKIVLKINAIP